jgi:hypothetical protein
VLWPNPRASDGLSRLSRDNSTLARVATALPAFAAPPGPCALVDLRASDGLSRLSRDNSTLARAARVSPAFAARALPAFAAPPSPRPSLPAGGRPRPTRPEPLVQPTSPSHKTRFRHLATIRSVQPSRAAISTPLKPSAASNASFAQITSR